MAEATKNEGWKGTAKGIGFLGSIVCGIAGFVANEWGGAVVGAISGFASGYLLVVLFVFVFESIKVIIGIAVTLFIIILLISSNIVRLEKAITGDHTASSVNTTKHVWFRNTCSEKVKIFLRWKSDDTNWSVNGPWEVEANKSVFFKFTGGDYLKSYSETIYYYAEIPGRNYAWSGNQSVQFNGSSYKMRDQKMPIDKDRDYNLDIHCQNLQ